MNRSSEKNLQRLRAALQASPDNLMLRTMYAEALLHAGDFNQAESEFLAALRADPDSTELQLGLAQTFFALGRIAQSEVLLDELLAVSKPPAAALLLHARVLLSNGDDAGAAASYFAALAADPALRSVELDSQLSDYRSQAMRSPFFDASESPLNEAEIDDEDEDDDEEEMRLPNTMPPGERELEAERPDKNFDDVGGMDEVKEEIRMKIIMPLLHPELFAAYGKQTGGGILLYGPPGCGKTWLARATAGEIKANFLSVGIHDVLDMWIGSSERNLHAIFEQARQSKPCVLFFDEVDALGADRSDMRRHGSRHLINQFLAELDGVQSDNSDVLVLAATNAPWHLDAAFRRPGRFDRILFIPPPDEQARAVILDLQLKGKPRGNIDLQALARRTDKFSGADLKSLVDIATEEKLREALRSGKPAPIETRDLKNALRKVRPSTADWFSSARNYALYSNVGGQYDDILTYLNIKK